MREKWSGENFCPLGHVMETKKMANAEFEMERKNDDRWTAPKLIGLTVVTLVVCLGVIYTLASIAAPY